VCKEGEGRRGKGLEGKEAVWGMVWVWPAASAAGSASVTAEQRVDSAVVAAAAALLLSSATHSHLFVYYAAAP